jgi:hypothetical protein
MMPDNPVTGREAQDVGSVFGGEKNTPHAVFQKSRTENAGATPQHRANDMAMACPTCEKAGTPGMRLFSRADAGYYCLQGHKWKDYDELLSLNPTKLAFKGIPAKQEGWEMLKLELPGSLLRELQAKFGEKLASTLRAVMDVLASRRFLMIEDENLDRLGRELGVDVKNADGLFGAVYAVIQEKKELKEENERLRQKKGPATKSATELTIDFGEIHDEILALARDRELEPSEIVKGVVDSYRANGWI